MKTLNKIALNKRIFASLLIIVSILANSTFMLLLPTKEVKAQDSSPANLIKGNSCIDNFIDCPADQYNLMEALGSNSLKITGGEINADKIISYLRQEWGADANRLCIPNTYKDIAQIYTNFVLVGVTGSPHEPRFCSPGNESQTAPESGFFSGYKVSGCCPAGGRYQLVTPTRVTLEAGGGAAYQNFAICCPIPQGARPGGTNYPYQNNQAPLTTVGQCMDINNVPVSDQSYVGDRAIIDGIPGGLTKSSSIINVAPTGGSSKVCGQSSVCSVVTSRDGPPTGVSNAIRLKNSSGGNTNQYVVPAQDLAINGNNISCSRCFNSGEAISVEANQLLVCDSTNLVKKQRLINNNVNDTLAFLATDSTNQPILAACRGQNGIYIAIGCVDPTPIGIITGLIRIALGVTGGIALVLLIAAGIAYQSGEEARIEEARNRLFSVLSGLAVLIFSVLILRIIGVNVLDVVPEGLF